MRIGPDGKKATICRGGRAEDELAAVGSGSGGAGWAGARSMTSTSGPGISTHGLKFVGLGYYAELPGVIFDIQRVGPSTGLPDAHHARRRALLRLPLACDTKHILLLPCSVEECYSMAMDAFDLAEKIPDAGLRVSD